MIKCLYIAGTLFMSDGQQAVSIGPNTKVKIDETEISVIGPRMLTRLQLSDTPISVEEVLWECDKEATEDVMRRDW